MVLKAELKTFLQTVMKYLVAVCLILCLSAPLAQAEEITAIDFNGDLLGKVIPDGKVVGFDNQLIGNVTADSLIVNFDGKLIGGVVPQGVAIGNDAKLLGKVSNDGSVRLSSGQIVGKVLPNGLVVNDYFDIIGAVIFPGLVYSDDGKTVGRITGDGLYTSLGGQQLGIVTPDGYAYRRIGTDYVLDGRLISSKMVVSLGGDFIGSVVPGGAVSDFDSEIIGYIKANGYAYDSQNQIIGRIVKSGYAFDNNGFYLGFVTYNGEIVENENFIGRLRADGKVVDPDGKVIGYSVDISAAATDLKGRYLGRIMPDGNIARAKDLTALVGARGIVTGADGSTIGQLSATGPVFDYKGALRGHALSNGSVIALSGTPVGYMVGSTAYDLSGRIIGGTLGHRLAYSASNAVLGMSGINSILGDNADKTILSPFGYSFSPEGELSGSNMPLSTVYGASGNVLGQSSFNGTVLNDNGGDIGLVNSSGFVTDGLSQLLGSVIPSRFAVGEGARLLGSLSEENMVMDTTMTAIGKILPDRSVINSPAVTEYMPVIGNAYEGRVVLDFRGALLGYTDINGSVNDLSGAKIGRVAEAGYALDNNNIVIGYLQNYVAVISDNCEVLGVLTPRGEIANYRGTYLGRILGNAQAVSDSSALIGYGVRAAPVIDFSGKIIGFSGLDGQVLDYSGNRLGCLNFRAKIRNADKTLIGKTVEYTSVIDFSGSIIGRSILDGSVVDNNSIVIGYQQPNDNINSTVGLPLGALFKYTVAFSLDNNKFIGRVLSDGRVVNDQMQTIGTVNFEGYVIADGQKVGYALYDFYVYDNEGHVIAVISRNGDVVSLGGSNLGVIDRGFLLDREQKVIGRGNRDYNIRDASHLVLGELRMDGEVLDIHLNSIGKLGKAGEILDRNNQVIAKASPLQYYSKVTTAQKVRIPIYDKDGKLIGYIDENGNFVDANGNIIGKRNEDGNLIGPDGKMIGRVDENGNIVDENGNLIGEVLNHKPVYDKDGNIIGYAETDGNVYDENGKLIGTVNANGEVVDANGNIIGGISANWYERAPAPPPVAKKEEDVSPALKLLESKEYRKSLGIALTPDGEYLGEIMEDGSVIDDNGNIVGHRMPDGMVMDDDGELVGIEEVKRPEAGNMFVPPGTFGNGGAYGTGVGPGGNLGPGGGYGPGERYDPSRQAALDAAMNERRKNITVGRISNGMRKEVFDGYQKDWAEQGIAKVVSSWRVDMSEMIFADKPIPAVIARAIDSNNPAPITAFVERNVYAEEGRNVVIPAGSRLMGTLGGVTASTEATSESARVQISWERLVRPDGSIFVFQGLTADAQGRAGALGYVDQQLFKKYTLPVLTTSLTSATSYFMAPNDDSKYDTETPRQQAANDARQNFLNEMNQVFDEILADKSSIKPMTYIPAGTRIIVFPNTDLWIRTAERDNDESALLQKPNILIDDGQAAIQRSKKQNEDIRKQAGTVVNSDVVYENDDAGVEAQKVTPLIDDKKKSKSAGGARPRTYVAPPPPPPSSGYQAPASSSSSNTNSSGVPALF